MQIDDRRFNRLALLGVSAGLLLLFVAFATVVLTLILNQRSNLTVTHTYQVVDRLKQLELYVERSETGLRGYLISPHPDRVRTYQLNSAGIQPTADRLAWLTSDNPVEVENIRQLRPLLTSELQTSGAIIRQGLNGDLEGARRTFATEVARGRVNRIRAITSAMRAEETGLLAQRSGETQALLARLFVVLAVTGVLLLLFGGTVIVIVKRYTEGLLEARDRLNRLNNDLEGAVAERTADLQRANDEIQRFAYVVSHDLRSPLVNILGFTAELEETNKSLGALIDRAELEAPQIISPDSRSAREDLPEAIGFIRSSTQKMDRLINAVTKLSREGRRSLSPESLDMSEIFDGVVASLAHPLTDSGTTATIENDIPDIVSDRVAIEQIFSNLVENAVKYSEPGRPGEVKLRGWKQGNRVIYEVADNGRGIDPKDHQRVFDLFRRSGAQDKQGEGIGLSHVRALAYRLGGFIDLQSELGQGARFQVNLPATYADQGGQS
jgi:signal transduction histidine kinase